MRWLTDAGVRDLLDDMEAVVVEQVDSEESELTEIAVHVLMLGGKRLRPALLFLAAQFGRPPDPAALVRAGAALELLHVASLYHDDVMDEAATRRTGPAAHTLWGAPAAVTAGTFLAARALRMLAELDPRIAEWAVQSALSLALGQLEEAENAFNVELQLRDYTRIAGRKTASLFELPCRLGALMTDASEEVGRALGLYGRALGMAFQAVDDARDFAADASENGKPVRTDLREGIYGMPTLIALSGDHRVAVPLKDLLERGEMDEPALAAAQDLITGAGAVAATLFKAASLTAQATDAIRLLPPGDAKVSLTNLARHVILRGSR